jgi:hypothetical protein
MTAACASEAPSGGPPIGAMPGPNKQVPPMQPRDVAAQFLAALRHGDVERMRHLVALPFLVEGFDLETGPERNTCLGLPGASEPDGWHIRVRTETGSNLSAVLKCLVQDPFFRNAIPDYPIRSWPKRLEGSTGTVGALREIRISQLPPSLKRYKEDLRSIEKRDVLVEMRATDNNGISLHGVLVIRSAQQKVTAFLLDERFEE